VRKLAPPRQTRQLARAARSSSTSPQASVRPAPTTNQRGPGRFPAPVTYAEHKTRLWHWPDVAHWLTEHERAKVDLDAHAADLLFISAGVLTALVAAAFHPAVAVWVSTWVLLTGLLMVVDMRQRCRVGSLGFADARRSTGHAAKLTVQAGVPQGVSFRYVPEQRLGGENRVRLP
jgi:hypothetical protein